jgi:hypothetical protein
MSDELLRVRGLRELVRATDRAGQESKKAVRGILRAAALHVRVAASELFSRYDTRSAAGYRVVVRQRGVAVQQSLRKTTGLRPDYGDLQMRKALLPALRREAAETERQMELAIDRIADHFDRD